MGPALFLDARSKSLMNRLLLFMLLLAALLAVGCGGEARNTNRDKDRPEPPPAGKK
jgi:hypothetical protein